MNKDNLKFIDASFLIALFLVKDDFHKRAKELWSELRGTHIIISKSVVGEVITVLKNRGLALNDVNGIYYAITNQINIIDDHYYHSRGLKECLNISIKGYSYWDALYVTIMRDLGIKEIVTFDTDFDRINGIVRIE